MADDPELAAWRAQRMAEMQGGAGGAPGGGPPVAGGRGGSRENAQEKEAQRQQMEEQRRLILKQILSTEASERLANVRLVKPDKARQLEDSIIGAARAGRLGGQVTEEQLKGFLGQLNQNEHKTKVTISRRRMAFDDDDEDDL